MNAHLFAQITIAELAHPSVQALSALALRVFLFARATSVEGRWAMGEPQTARCLELKPREVSRGIRELEEARLIAVETWPQRPGDRTVWRLVDLRPRRAGGAK